MYKKDVENKERKFHIREITLDISLFLFQRSLKYSKV